MKREWIKREKTVKNVCSIDTHTHTHVYARRFFLSWMFNSAIALDSLYLIRIILVQLIYLFILFILYFGCVHFFEHHIQAFANYISFFGERTVQLFFFRLLLWSCAWKCIQTLALNSNDGRRIVSIASKKPYSNQHCWLSTANLRQRNQMKEEEKKRSLRCLNYYRIYWIFNNSMCVESKSHNLNNCALEFRKATNRESFCLCNGFPNWIGISCRYHLAIQIRHHLQCNFEESHEINIIEISPKLNLFGWNRSPKEPWLY